MKAACKVLDNIIKNDNLTKKEIDILASYMSTWRELLRDWQIHYAIKSTKKEIAHAKYCNITKCESHNKGRTNNCCDIFSTIDTCPRRKNPLMINIGNTMDIVLGNKKHLEGR